MKNSFAFLSLSTHIEGIISLPIEAKEKKNPFIIVNTDNDRGLYIKALEQEIAKYKNLKSADGDKKFYDIESKNLIVFGDSPKFDYRIEMNNITLLSLMGKDVKVYDLVEDYSKIVRRLATYAKNNGVKKLSRYRNEDFSTRMSCICVEEKSKVVCPLLRNVCPTTTKVLVNVYSQPDLSVEKITVHHNWVKIGYRQYDIYVDLFGNETIFLEDGTKMYVKTDRFGRRYLAA